MELTRVQQPGKEGQVVGPHKPQAWAPLQKGQKIHPQQGNHLSVTAEWLGTPFALPQTHTVLLIPVIYQGVYTIVATSTKDILTMGKTSAWGDALLNILRGLLLVGQSL